MKEIDKTEIKVISAGRRSAEIVLIRPGSRKGTRESETRHLLTFADGYADRQGNFYRESGGGLKLVGHVTQVSAAKSAAPQSAAA